jgi:serine protease Do
VIESASGVQPAEAVQPAPPVPPRAPSAPEGPQREIERVYSLGPELFVPGSRIGARVRDITREDVSTMKLDSQAGAVVEEVISDSAAAKAGVKQGDVVVTFDGERVRSARTLTRLVTETPAGRTVKMDVVRSGGRTTLDVTPESPEEAMSMRRPFMWRGQAPGAPAPGMRMRVMPEIPEVDVPEIDIPDMPEHFELMVSPGRARLGVGVSDLTPELANHFGASAGGVLVNSVDADSPAAKAGVKVGDVITRVGETAVDTAAELRRELARADKGDAKTADVTVGLVRDKKPMDVKVTIERREPTKRTVVRQRVKV